MHKISGTLSEDDYRSFQSVSTARFQSNALLFYNVFLLIAYALMFAVLWQMSGDRKLAMGAVMLAFLCHYISYKLYLLMHNRDYRKWMDNVHSFNIGECTYELLDDRMAFQGTTYNAEVPYANMQALKSTDGFNYIEFSCGNGFMLPHDEHVDEGDYAAFKQRLQDLIDGLSVTGNR